MLIIDCGSTKTRDIAGALSGTGSNPKIVPMDKLNTIDPVGFRGVIIGGSSIMYTEMDDIDGFLDKFRLIDELNIPVLGICFGHQTVGLLFGSGIYRGEEVRRTETIRIKRHDPLFAGFGDWIDFTEDHTEGITLPPGFVCLARSEHYEVEVMKHKDKPIYGVQFHPEVSGENGRKLLGNFCQMCA